MAARTKSIALDVPGYRVTLVHTGERGWVNLSQRASKDTGNHAPEGHDGGESCRNLWRAIKSEIRSVGRANDVYEVTVTASKRGCQPWTVDVIDTGLAAQRRQAQLAEDEDAAIEANDLEIAYQVHSGGIGAD